MKLSKAFVIVTVSSRINDLNTLLESLKKYIDDFEDWDVCVLLQDNLGLVDTLDKTLITHLWVEQSLMGCNAARISLLNRMKRYDVYCNLDDDIEATEYTNYEPAILKALEDSTGFVLTNWARTEKMLLDKVPKMANKFVPQVFVYQGGGMIYTEKIAKIVRRLPMEQTVFDEGWPLASYLNGYNNYRYLGSLAIHRICTKGGMNEYYKQVDYSKLKNLFPKYINYRKSERGEWHIPEDSDLTELAKETHRRNIK